MTKGQLLDILTSHRDDDDAEIIVAVERRDGGSDLAGVCEVRYQREEDGYEADELFIGARIEDTPDDIVAIRAQICAFLETRDERGRQIGRAKWGVYAFYDYDGEPIYVGQTNEQLRVRIRRHLTNQRTDAVAMSVLDPLEVAEIEVWPFWECDQKLLNAAEYTVFKSALARSSFGAVLNEGDIAETSLIELPPSIRGRIVPREIYKRTKHPDVRIARRATTIAALARVISERRVSTGLRRTLRTQALRLERLAAERYAEVKRLRERSHDGQRQQTL